MGGPVWIPKIFNGKDRLFFMGNYESFRQRQSSQATYNLPSAAMRTGDFSELLARGIVIYDPATRTTGADGKIMAQPFPGNIIPAGRISDTSKKFLQLYPSPNLPNASLIRDFSSRNRRRATKIFSS